MAGGGHIPPRHAALAKEAARSKASFVTGRSVMTPQVCAHPALPPQVAMFRRAMQQYTKRVAIAAVGVRPWVQRLQVRSLFRAASRVWVLPGWAAQGSCRAPAHLLALCVAAPLACACFVVGLSACTASC